MVYGSDVFGSVLLVVTMLTVNELSTSINASIKRIQSSLTYSHLLVTAIFLTLVFAVTRETLFIYNIYDLLC